MSRNICDQGTSPVGIDGDEPVEISCYGGHRAICGTKPEMGEFGNASGKNRRLYLSSRLQFRLDGKQTTFVRKQYLQSYVPQLKQEGSKA